MPINAYIVVALLVAVVAFALRGGTGALVGFHLDSRAEKPLKHESPVQPEPRFSEPFSAELTQCVQLAESVAKEAEALAAMAVRPSPPTARELDSALSSMAKTVRSLAARLRRVGKGETAATDEEVARPLGPPVAQPSPAPAIPADDPSASLVQADDTAARSQPAVGLDDRHFPRAPCPGSFKATIYPPPSKPDGKPVQCNLLTRDISCGGIGIAHTEELFPKQIVVVYAVPKLLIGEVRWCRRVSERSYIAGCQLIKTAG